jgi:hypothetical protein
MDDEITLDQLDEALRYVEEAMIDTAYLVWIMAHRFIISYRYGERFVV